MKKARKLEPLTKKETIKLWFYYILIIGTGALTISLVMYLSLMFQDIKAESDFMNECRMNHNFSYCYDLWND